MPKNYLFWRGFIETWIDAHPLSILRYLSIRREEDLNKDLGEVKRWLSKFRLPLDIYFLLENKTMDVTNNMPNQYNDVGSIITQLNRDAAIDTLKVSAHYLLDNAGMTDQTYINMLVDRYTAWSNITSIGIGALVGSDTFLYMGLLYENTAPLTTLYYFGPGHLKVSEVAMFPAIWRVFQSFEINNIPPCTKAINFRLPLRTEMFPSAFMYAPNIRSIGLALAKEDPVQFINQFEQEHPNVLLVLYGNEREIRQYEILLGSRDNIEYVVY